jgi:hypothetical protein
VTRSTTLTVGLENGRTNSLMTPNDLMTPDDAG